MVVLGMVCLNQARGIARCPANGRGFGVPAVETELLGDNPGVDKQIVRSVVGVPPPFGAVAYLLKQADLLAAEPSCCSLHKELLRIGCVRRLPFLTNW